MRRLWRSRPRAIRNLFGKDRATAAQFAAQEVLTAFGDLLPKSFDDLVIPLKVIATDYSEGREIVLTEGPLVPAVGASMSLPFLFRPVVIDGRAMVDGGLVNPVPFEHADIDGGILIAVDVLPGPRSSSGRIPRRIETLIGGMQIQMQALIQEKLSHLRTPDILVEPQTAVFEPFDFIRAAEIMDAARPAAEQFKHDLQRLLV